MTATRPDTIESTQLRRLRSRVRGDVVTPDEPAYDDARRAWNLNAQHRPALIVLAEDAAGVGHAVRFARAADLGVGVLATGHGTGQQPCDGGVLINTTRMRDVQIAPATRTARVQAGAIWQDVVERAAVHGLAGLPGSSATVGVVGSTLGGGFGWLGRRYGLAAHSIIRAEVVTADGDLVVADATEHPDLFWALHGATGNLGIVTALEFALHPVQTVYAGNLYYPLQRARDVLEFFAEWSASTPDELTAAATFRAFPPLPTIPEPLSGARLVALRGCFCGDPADGAALIDQARAALGPATVDTFTAMPASDLAAISMDPVQPLAAMSHCELIADLRPEVIDVLVDLAGPDSESPLVMLEVRQLGGALPGPDGALSPMAHTDASHSLNAIGVTPTPAHATTVRAHLDRVAADLRPYVTGDAYVNWLDLEGATPERIRASYSAADWDRLVRIKSEYDPQNVFRFNRNIHDHLDPTPKARTR